ncbi:MAG: cytochrome c oxidase subunit II [Opitutaceae bacterium]|nr:cytochrome c oxidase subunit II [Opitutaceae bacterium]MBP9912320.1 cytochrome c oxidase subunit II [Opitutaceae bacterium]
MRLPSLLSNITRWSRAGLVLGVLTLLTGCDLNFWRMDGHQTTMVTAGPVAKSQLEVFYVTCWVTFIIFIIVGSVLAYATIKFKAHSEADENAEPPEQGHGNPLVEIGLIAASVLALVIISIPTLKGIWFTYEVPEEQRANAYEITATGYQWWFKFEYPKEQIEGVGPLVTANELVIPAGRPVTVQLRTFDVIHSFWVPKLAGKVDMIPNRGNHLWLQADEPGYFWGQCAEYCGDSHAVMRFRVIALSEKDFAEWLTAQKAPARSVAATADTGTAAAKAQFASFKRNEYGFSDKWAADAPVNPLDNWRQQQFPAKDENPALIAQGRKIFNDKTCVTCHTVRGHEGIGTLAPNLTHIGSRTTIAGGLLENNSAQLARWLHEPNEVKPGNKMYNGYGPSSMQGYVVKNEDGSVTPHITLTDADVTALVAYLESLK